MGGVGGDQTTGIEVVADRLFLALVLVEILRLICTVVAASKRQEDEDHDEAQHKKGGPGSFFFAAVAAATWLSRGCPVDLPAR